MMRIRPDSVALADHQPRVIRAHREAGSAESGSWKIFS